MGSLQRGQQQRASRTIRADLLEGGPDNLQRILTVLLRMSVINAQGLREVTGSFYRTFVIRTDSPIMEAAIKAGTT